MNNTKSLPIWPMSLLITGNVLGVGVLALPIKTGLSGFTLATISIIGIWMMMCFTALIIAKRIHPTDNLRFDIPSFFKQEIGSKIKWLVIVANLIILYGLITAYLSMVGSLVTNLLPKILHPKFIIILYFIILLFLISYGIKILRRSNMIIIICIWVSFIILIHFAKKPFNPDYLTYMDWRALPFSLPVIVSTFHFHNIIPTVCYQLNFQYKAIKRAIIQGTLIGLCINLLWITLVLGDLPVHGITHLSIIYAAAHGEPATVPLALDLHSDLFILFSMIFALFAVTASYMANGTGLLNFIRDLVSHFFKTDNTPLCFILAFAPPLIITLFDPRIFLKAINLVGGVGETILFGILPALILLKSINVLKTESSSKSVYGYLILTVSCFILIFAVLQQFLPSSY
ncbi:MAG: hypothetical protein A3E87_03560 [Gammaproteobacteria bacterium RIFCSPHIGHO2_12_FULL_35_23]|nr:MAG: hypothetical protein A3E87_03560 [Gammaproteobacteria bacterium RIFCSPHIGHO2_12_FULL_35_23]